MAILFFLIKNSQIKFDLLAQLFYQPLLFFLMIFLLILTIGLNAQRWHILNKAQSIDLGFVRTLKPTFLGIAFNNLLPGSVGGDFIRSYYLFKKAPQHKSLALLSIFLDRVLGFLGLLIMVCLTSFLSLSHFLDKPKLFPFFLMFAFFCLTLLSFFIILILLPQHLKIIDWAIKRLPSWAKPVVSFLLALQNYRLTKKIIFQCLVLSVIIQLLVTLVIMIIAKSMNLPPIAFSDYNLASSITQVVNLIPISPGGIGIGEIAFANILLLLNPLQQVAWGTVFLAYRMMTFITFIPGIIYYLPRFIFLKQKNPT